MLFGWHKKTGEITISCFPTLHNLIAYKAIECEIVISPIPIPERPKGD